MANTYVVIHQGRAYGMFNTYGAAESWAKSALPRRGAIKILSVEQYSEPTYRYEDM